MKKILLFVMGLVMNMVPVMAEGATYSMEYEKLSHQSAVVYQPTTKTTKTGIGVVVMYSDEDYQTLKLMWKVYEGQIIRQ